jgi:hypothetical protein
VNISYDEILEIIRSFLLAIPVDEVWYLNKYSDVAKAIAEGRYKSAKHHFIDEGYFEGRLPGNIVVDQNWYLAKYPDVAEGLAKGTIKSINEHYRDHGYGEGRLPADYR